MFALFIGARTVAVQRRGAGVNQVNEAVRRYALGLVAGDTLTRLRGLQ